ncbi:hypothetical protein [uncultured Maritimibacter sp.]|uniref:hypothetical protein n=1 Tax=uncultured Maritimibacter sp. TaxID=991866 RepID=UPI002627B480|nr:hypothetical protein [uncultured Maritimibacter sp.]
MIGALALGLPAQALALSCMPYPPTVAYETADASDKVYSVVRGSFTYDAEGAPSGYDENAPEDDWLTTGRITGNVLTPEGYSSPVDAEVVVVISCVGPWCPTLAQDDDALMFVRQEADGKALYLDVAACQSNVFTGIEEQAFEDMQACMAGDCPEWNP